MEILKIEIPIEPRSKKNHQQMVMVKGRLIVIPSNSHNGLNKDKSGIFLPFSQLPIDLSVTPSFSANSVCVIFLFLRHSAINLPIFFF